MGLRGGFAGLGFARQDSGAFFAVLPEVAVGGLYWLVGDRRDRGERGLHRGCFVLWCGGGVVGNFCDWVVEAGLRVRS
jgi:hypothetical protein